MTLGGLDMTHTCHVCMYMHIQHTCDIHVTCACTCLFHVVRASEGHGTELSALVDANRRRDLINESRDQHKSAAKI